MMLAQFTEMIGILLNNCRDIPLRPAVVNLSAVLFLLFKISVNIVSSLHIATVETQRYAFLLFSVIMTEATVEIFVFQMRCCSTQ